MAGYTVTLNWRYPRRLVIAYKPIYCPSMVGFIHGAALLLKNTPAEAEIYERAGEAQEFSHPVPQTALDVVISPGGGALYC